MRAGLKALRLAGQVRHRFQVEQFLASLDDWPLEPVRIPTPALHSLLPRSCLVRD